MNSLLVDLNRWASFSSIQLILLHTSILFIYDATLLGLGHFPSHCDDHPSPKDDNLVRLKTMESSQRLLSLYSMAKGWIERPPPLS